MNQKNDLDPSSLVNIPQLAWQHGITEEEAQIGWDEGKLAISVGGVKVQCTGRNTHKPAFIGWLRVGVFSDGEYALGMSEAGNARNIQNSKGLQHHKLLQGNFWPLKDDDGGYLEGASGESYRFLCGRCSRDFQINPNKLGQAAQAMIVNRRKYLDLSLLPFG